MTFRTAALTVLLALLPAATQAKLVTKEVPYEHDGTKLVGYLAYDDKYDTPRPGVLVVHEWWGLNDYARKRTEMLAELGYVAFALDMYGEKVTEHPKEAGEWSGEIRSNVKQWRERALSGLKVLTEQKNVDYQNIAAIGYCFGGSTVLQMAFAGEPLKAVVTFHGGLVVPSEEEAEGIKTAVLVCHGASDSFIPEKTAQEFREALTKADVDWMMVYYANAKHGFTNPGADEYGLPPLGYNKKADKRSWTDMQDFLKEKLK